MANWSMQTIASSADGDTLTVIRGRAPHRGKEISEHGRAGAIALDSERAVSSPVNRAFHWPRRQDWFGSKTTFSGAGRCLENDCPAAPLLAPFFSGPSDAFPRARGRISEDIGNCGGALAPSHRHSGRNGGTASNLTRLTQTVLEAGVRR